MTPSDSTPVLTGAIPQLSTADAVEIGATAFGVSARHARDLGSERDRTFLLQDGQQAPVAVLKVSNASEDPEVLDMEAAAALHVNAVDPGLRVALPWRAGVVRRRGAGENRRRAGAAARRVARALGAALRHPARQQPDLRRRALRRGADRLGRDDGPPRAGAARVHAPAGAAHDVLGCPARAGGARDARRHPRSARPGGRRAGARRVRAPRDPGVAAAARAGRAHRPVGRQHADRRRRLHHRHHRLRRREPHGADHRPGVGAGLRRQRSRRAPSSSASPASSSTATSAASRSRTSSSRCSGSPGRHAAR